MAWWNTYFIFQDNTLIAEGFEPPFLHNLEWVVHEGETVALSAVEVRLRAVEQMPNNGHGRFTRVIVSGYALYGELRGYYALGVAHWWLDKAAGRAYLSEASQRHCESVSSLTSAQRAILRECLMRLNPEAWETSNLSFRQQLEPPPPVTNRRRAMKTS